MENPFKLHRDSVFVSEKHGSISAEITEPRELKAILTLGHGAGSRMDQPFLVKLSEALAAESIGTIRFNFLYSEAGRRMPDRFPKAAEVVRAVLRLAGERYKSLPLFGGGKSFGGRMTSMTVAEGVEENVRGLVFFGFPLHPAGSPSVERAAHLKEIAKPMLFLQGTRDELATSDLIREVVAGLPLAKLIELEGADHSFKGGKQAGVDSLARLTAEWLLPYT